MKNYCENHEGNAGKYLAENEIRADWYSQMPIDKCQKIIEEICKTDEPDKIRRGFFELLREQPVLNFNYYPGQIFWRGRKFESGDLHVHVKDLFCPPLDKTKTPGRLNNLQSSLLYTTTKKSTAYAEIHAESGDYVYLVGYKMKGDKTIKVKLIGEFFHIYRTGLSLINPSLGHDLHRFMNKSLNYDIWKSIVFVDAFFASVLRDENERTNGYLRTRILYELISSKVQEVPGIFYPSVAQTGGMNFAISSSIAEDVFEVHHAALMCIKKKFHFGFYDAYKMHDCIRIENDGSLVLSRSDGNRCWKVVEGQRHPNP